MGAATLHLIEGGACNGASAAHRVAKLCTLVGGAREDGGFVRLEKENGVVDHWASTLNKPRLKGCLPCSEGRKGIHGEARRSQHLLCATVADATLDPGLFRPEILLYQTKKKRCIRLNENLVLSSKRDLTRRVISRPQPEVSSVHPRRPHTVARVAADVACPCQT